MAALAHYGFDLDWYLAVLVGTAVAPTDPAVVFSVLGQRELGGAQQGGQLADRRSAGQSGVLVPRTQPL